MNWKSIIQEEEAVNGIHMRSFMDMFGQNGMEWAGKWIMHINHDISNGSNPIEIDARKLYAYFKMDHNPENGESASSEFAKWLERSSKYRKIRFEKGSIIFDSY